MKVASVISSIDNQDGGPSRSVTNLLAEIGRNFPDLKLDLHTAISDDLIRANFGEKNSALNLYTKVFFGKFKGLNESLLASNPELFHAHTLWGLPMHQMVSIAQKLSAPYIISPRGMLEPWALQQKKLKKKLALWLYQRKDLERAACLHATSEMEAENLRTLGFKNPIAIIPNGIPLAEFEVKKGGERVQTKKLLFLSRLHPKKGIEMLLEAWAGLSPELRRHWSIEIVGNGDPTYIEQLRKIKEGLGLSSQVIIKGPVYGSDKAQLYQSASLFVLPTYSENFGIVVAEALACGVPVITTKGAPWQELELHDCGWWIDIGVAPLIKALQTALALPSKELEQMGRNGRNLIESKYSMQAIATQMHQLYQWILGQGGKPEFVYL